MLTWTGSFTSPNYPLPYHPNAECYWRIKSSQGSLLRLSFSDFHLEASGTCRYDYLAVSSATVLQPRLTGLSGEASTGGAVFFFTTVYPDFSPRSTVQISPEQRYLLTTANSCAFITPSVSVLI